jgi:squalene-hopene/tetraprenyl-beta-curcumene cyclase
VIGHTWKGAAADTISDDENPGFGQRGPYYYYQTFAKAMDLYGEPFVADSSGHKHDWRAELITALAKRQNANRSWVNSADNFIEGDPNIVTAYRLLALGSARPKR